MPVGFILDLDGVITDTAEYHFRAWKKLADEEGIPFTREDNEALRGVSRRESLRRLLKGREIDEATAEAWMERKNATYRALLAEMTERDLLPGARAFLESARAAGIKIGLASASRNAPDVIRSLGIGPLFDVLGDGYSVVRSKPAPDLFVWVAGGLGLPVTSCVVFEDAEAGVEAALSAGMACVGIGPVERVGRASLVCEGLHAITVAQAAALVTDPYREAAAD
jgi:beta-phosphoglucomutase